MDPQIQLSAIVAAIEELRPELMVDGRLDMAALKKFLKPGYQLVWEDQPEDEVDIREAAGQHPLLALDEAPSLLTRPGKPVHRLIRGDNYHALKVLNYTHAESFDLIYIDPPYNTGNRDFKYNDKFVEREDGYRHSKWLSFMDKRLRLAWALLKETGALLISIDENEYAQLKLLCDDIFLESSYVNTLIVKRRPKNVNAQFEVITSLNVSYEYILVYRKSPRFRYVDPFKAKEASLQDGYWSSFYSSADRPTMRYKIGQATLTKGQWKWSKERGLRAYQNYQDYLQNAEGRELKEYWEQTKDAYKESTGFDLEFVREQGKSAGYWVQPSTRTLMDTNLLDYYVNDDSAKRLYEFPTAKNPELIKKLITMFAPKDGAILDFFAGSGTTAHAAMLLNAEDKGTRTVCLVTNDEGTFKDPAGEVKRGGICTNVTIPRLTNALNGTLASGAEALEENLIVLDTVMYESRIRERGDYAEQKAFLIQAIGLLRFKEAAFAEVKSYANGTGDDWDTAKPWGVYRTVDGNRTLVVLLDENKAEACAKYIETLKGAVALYPFSYEDDTSAESACAHLKPRVTVEPVPAQLLHTYRRLKRNPRRRTRV